jgi:hypothetical protein
MKFALFRDGVFTGRTYSGPVLHRPATSENDVWKAWTPGMLYVADDRPIDAWSEVRLERNQLLRSSDWIVTRATERGEPVPAEWVAYRQALRDITGQPDPLAIIWPTAPAK